MKRTNENHGHNTLNKNLIVSKQIPLLLLFIRKIGFTVPKNAQFRLHFSLPSLHSTNLPSHFLAKSSKMIYDFVVFTEIPLEPWYQGIYIYIYMCIHGLKQHSRIPYIFIWILYYIILNSYVSIVIYLLYLILYVFFFYSLRLAHAAYKRHGFIFCVPFKTNERPVRLKKDFSGKLYAHIIPQHRTILTNALGLLSG